MPRRPLSAYNLFFKSERQRIVIEINKNRGPDEGKPTRRNRPRKLGIGFAGLARDIAKKWKAMSKGERTIFEDRARQEKERYDQEVELWKKENPEQSMRRRVRKSKSQTKKAATPPSPVAVSHSLTNFIPTGVMPQSPNTVATWSVPKDPSSSFGFSNVPSCNTTNISLADIFVNCGRGGEDLGVHNGSAFSMPFQPVPLQIQEAPMVSDISSNHLVQSLLTNADRKPLDAECDLDVALSEEQSDIDELPDDVDAAFGPMMTSPADELERFMESVETEDVW